MALMRKEGEQVTAVLNISRSTVVTTDPLRYTEP